MRHAQNLSETSPEIHVSLHKDENGRASDVRRVSLRIRGAFPAATAWALLAPDVQWLRAEGSSAATFNVSGDPQDADLRIVFNASGLRAVVTGDGTEDGAAAVAL
jgi:hypothetical protein